MDSMSKRMFILLANRSTVWLHEAGTKVDALCYVWGLLEDWKMALLTASPIMLPSFSWTCGIQNICFFSSKRCYSKASFLWLNEFWKPCRLGSTPFEVCNSLPSLKELVKTTRSCFSSNTEFLKDFGACTTVSLTLAEQCCSEQNCWQKSYQIWDQVLLLFVSCKGFSSSYHY